MKKLTSFDWIAIILLVVGGLNWDLIGFFKFDLVATFFGEMSILSRIVYNVIGLYVVYVLIMTLSKKIRKKNLSYHCFKIATSMGVSLFL